MLLFEISGGLGNQLFQYLFAKELEAKTGEVIKFDWSFYTRRGKETRRAFYLQKLFPNEFYVRRSLLARCTQRISRLIYKRTSVRIGGFREVNDTTFANWTFREGESVLFRGFWQRDNIPSRGTLPLALDERILSLRERSFKDQILATESVAVHIRRGDYLSGINAKIYSCLGRSYYSRAIDEIRRQVMNPVFFVFSDDKEHVADVLPDCDYLVVPSSTGDETIRDFWFMSCCKHSVIANSTFSYLAGLFGIADGGLIVGPADWYVSPDKRGPKHWRIWEISNGDGHDSLLQQF